MGAFSEEQQAILREALNHVWVRMENLHDDMNSDSLRLASVFAALVEHGVLTDEEIDRVMTRLHVEASHRSIQGPGSTTEQETTAAILKGDLEAFRRRQTEEEH